MLINVKIENHWREEWKAKLPEIWPKMQKYWPLATDTEPPTSMYGLAGPCRITTTEAMELTKLGIELSVQPLPGAMVTKMQDDPAKYWEYGSRIDPIDVEQGRAVQITVPDMALIYIDEVTNLDDLCTDELQRYLDEGWRILAVCPPNSQRRPDYILGRRKKQDPFS